KVVDHLDLHLHVGQPFEQTVDRRQVRPVAPRVDAEDPVRHQATPAVARGLAAASSYRFHGSRWYSPSQGVPAASQYSPVVRSTMLEAIVWFTSVPCVLASPCLHTEFGYAKWSRSALWIARRTPAVSLARRAAASPAVRRGSRQSEF